MTVQARRYGRWCREHFDVVAAAGRSRTPAAPTPPRSRPEPEPEPVKPVAEQPQG